MTEQDLTFVRLTEDGSRLVLVGGTGAEFTLVVDEKLRSALRGMATRDGRLEKTMESTLRPRDIQARIRAGESPEDVAAAAQTTVDRIMGYATPVLAERAHIAERAQRASVRRKANEGPARLLGDAVAEQLRARNVDPASVEWDAWRREDGRWTLVADYGVGGSGSHAEFVFDAPGRYVVPDDDTARWLVGEAAPAPAAPVDPAGRRLSAVTSADQELPLGEDAIGMVTGRTAEDEERTVDLTATAHAVRQPERTQHPAAQQHPPVDPTAVTGDGDWMATQATERPTPPPVRPAPVEQPAEAEPEEPAAEAPAASEEPAAEEPQEPPRRAVKKSRGRASVPSWDEIMFGGGRSE
ncbi:MAG: septation protein SepH [Nocardioidaceae bacterium]